MTQHIIPLNDLKEHTESTTCQCGPEVQFPNGDMIVIHNSFDGREQYENMIDTKLPAVKINMKGLYDDHATC